MSETWGHKPDPVDEEVDISFVVTIFNKAPFVSGMVDSLREEGRTVRAEYIFIDDGSSDDSVERVLAATQDLSRVTILRQENKGPAFATNAGVQTARGRYIKLLDADDRLVRGSTALLKSELDRAHGDLIIGRLSTYDSGEIAETDLVGPATVLDDPLITIIARGLSNTSGSMFRRASFIASGGCDETIFVQDFSYFLRLAHRGRILTTDSIVALVPEVAVGRVSGMVGQALHDTNRALYNFVSDHSDLPGRYRRLAMRRAAGRAWKWASRRRGTSVFSKPFLVHLVSRLPFADLAPWVLRNSCRPFYAETNLRFVGPQL